MNLEIRICTKQFLKEKKELQEAIISSVKDLLERIQAYEKQGVGFEKIFNDDCVKYDKHGDFFMFKCHKGKFQLRILYAYLKIAEETVVFIVDYFIKKKNNKKYIEKFDVWNRVNIAYVCRNVYQTISI